MSAQDTETELAALRTAATELAALAARWEASKRTQLYAVSLRTILAPLRPVEILPGVAWLSARSMREHLAQAHGNSGPDLEGCDAGTLESMHQDSHEFEALDHRHERMPRILEL